MCHGCLAIVKSFNFSPQNVWMAPGTQKRTCVSAARHEETHIWNPLWGWDEIAMNRSLCTLQSIGCVWFFRMRISFATDVLVREIKKQTGTLLQTAKIFWWMISFHSRNARVRDTKVYKNIILAFTKWSVFCYLTWKHDRELCARGLPWKLTPGQLRSGYTIPTNWCENPQKRSVSSELWCIQKNASAWSTRAAYPSKFI